MALESETITAGDSYCRRYPRTLVTKQPLETRSDLIISIIMDEKHPEIPIHTVLRER